MDLKDLDAFLKESRITWCDHLHWLAIIFAPALTFVLILGALWFASPAWPPLPPQMMMPQFPQLTIWGR
jgi:hypothetical protein